MEEKKKVSLSNYRSAKDTDFIKNCIGETYEEKSELQKEIVVDFFTKTVTQRIKPKDRVLDLGCGTGNTTLKFLPLVGDEGFVIGTDVSEGMIKKAKEKEEKDGILKFEVADSLTFSQEPFIKSEEFDVVFSSYMLHWVEDKKTVFQQIFNHLKPEGCFIGTFGIVMSPETPTTEVVNECCDIVLTEKPEHVEMFLEPPDRIRKVLEEEIGFEMEVFDCNFPISEFKGKDKEEVMKKMVNHYETIFTMGCHDPDLHKRLLRLIAKKTFEVADTKDHPWSNILIKTNDGKEERVNYCWVERKENEVILKMRWELVEFVARKKN